MGQGEHLREIVRSLGWSYAVLWSLPPLMTELVRTDGWYQVSAAKLSQDHWNVERLFNTFYKNSSFAPGFGYVGRVFTQGQHVWSSGNAVLRLSDNKNSAQALFFESAGIQTVLCIPWFNSVVELGTDKLVPENQNLLQQIRSLLSHTPPSQLQQSCLKHQADDGSKFIAFSPTEGPLPSQETEGGASDTTLNPPVDSCASFSFEDRLRMQRQQLHHHLPRSDQHQGSLKAGDRFWEQGPSVTSKSVAHGATDAGHDLNGEIGADWRLDFSSDIPNLTSSPTSTLQDAVFTPMSSTEPEDLDCSFLGTQSDPMSAMSQAKTQRLQPRLSSKNSVDNRHAANMSMTTTQRSQNSHSSNSHRSSLDFRGSTSKKSIAFKPWKDQKPPVIKRHRNQSNQVLLRRSLDMVHQISHFNAKKEEKRRSEMKALAMRRAATDAREVHSCHDEAAVNHMLAERKRREKQKENFSALRALIPFVSKMDRASILGDAIQYVKQLKTRVMELENRNRELEAQIPNRRI